MRLLLVLSFLLGLAAAATKKAKPAAAVTHVGKDLTADALFKDSNAKFHAILFTQKSGAGGSLLSVNFEEEATKNMKDKNVRFWTADANTNTLRFQLGGKTATNTYGVTQFPSVYVVKKEKAINFGTVSMNSLKKQSQITVQDITGVEKWKPVTKVGGGGGNVGMYGGIGALIGAIAGFLGGKLLGGETGAGTNGKKKWSKGCAIINNADPNGNKTPKKLVDSKTEKKLKPADGEFEKLVKKADKKKADKSKKHPDTIYWSKSTKASAYIEKKGVKPGFRFVQMKAVKEPKKDSKKKPRKKKPSSKKPSKKKPSKKKPSKKNKRS